MRLNLFTSSIVLSLLLFAAGFHAPARAQRQGDSGAASISGRVTIEGKPAPGVIVVVTRVDGAADAGKLSDTTDSEGRFNVTGLKPGEYAITPQSHVFVLSNRNPGLFNDGRITLGAGEAVDDVSLELTRDCVVTGRVIDENGRPVIGGYVSLGRPRDIGASRTEIEYFNPLIPGAGETDDRGVYRIFGVPAGHYLVMVSTQAGLGRNAINYQVFYPNASDQSKAKLIELSAGEEKTDINITIVPPERTYTVSGRLIDAASGKPVPYVLVWSWALDGGANRRIFQSYIDNRITDEEGSFLIAGLSSGRHLLSIGTMSDRDTEWYSDDLIVDVAGEDLSGIELKAHAGASISGEVTIEGANGRRTITNPAGVTVTAFASDSDAHSGRSSSYRVGASGKFRLPGLRAGMFRLIATMMGGGPERSLSMDRVEVAGQPAPNVIELKEGQHLSGVRVVMVYGDGVARGQVKFQNGERPKNACFQVQAYRKNDCAWCVQGFQSSVSAGGQYALAGLPPGEYELTLFAHSCGSGEIPAIAPVKQSIIVADGGETRADFIVDLSRRDQ